MNGAVPSSSSTTTSRWAAGNVPRTTLLTYGTPGFAVGYQPHSPIVGALHGRAEIPTSVLGRVVIDDAGPRPDS